MSIFSQIPPQLELFLIVFFALILGSFTSLLTYRINSKEPIVWARSKCTSCNKILGVLNLIPLFSWIFQRGKCSNCKSKISPRYPLIELSSLICFLTIYFAANYQISYVVILQFLIAETLIVMCVVDLEHYYIPDLSQYFLTILVTLLLFDRGESSLVIKNLPAAFIFMGFGLLLWLYFYLTIKIEAIGIDDIKFFFIIGLMLGTESFLGFMMLSGLFGIIFGFIWQKLKEEDTFPFAPSICCSAFVCMVFGDKIDPTKLLGMLIF